LTLANGVLFISATVKRSLRRSACAGNQTSLLWMAEKPFVSGGPQRGKIVEPKLILASGDLVAIDVEAVRVLLSYKATNRLISDPWQIPQIATAVKHRLGAGEDGYMLVT